MLNNGDFGFPYCATPAFSSPAFSAPPPQRTHSAGFARMVQSAYTCDHGLSVVYYAVRRHVRAYDSNHETCKLEKVEIAMYCNWTGRSPDVAEVISVLSLPDVRDANYAPADKFSNSATILEHSATELLMIQIIFFAPFGGGGEIFSLLFSELA